MTTEGGPSHPLGRTKVVTKLPATGSVLVRSAGPPAVPARHTVDVRPGAFATFDGDRLRMALAVRADGERRRFDRSQLPALEVAVTEFLEGGGDGGEDREDAMTPRGVEEGRGAVVRFGDLAACRRLLPPAACAAIERRLGAAAGAGSAPLLAWTTDAPEPEDYRNYDVVLDEPPAAGR